MDLLKPPEPLQLSGNLSQNWKRFKQKLELFIKATTPKDDPRSGAAKASLLLSVAGDEALDVFNTFTFGEQEDKEDYDTLVQKFEAYCAEYVPGKHLVLADMLLRSTTPGGVDNAGATEDVEVHALQLLNGKVTVCLGKGMRKDKKKGDSWWESSGVFGQRWQPSHRSCSVALRSAAGFVRASTAAGPRGQPAAAADSDSQTPAAERSAQPTVAHSAEPSGSRPSYGAAAACAANVAASSPRPASAAAAVSGSQPAAAALPPSPPCTPPVAVTEHTPEAGDRATPGDDVKIKEVGRTVASHFPRRPAHGHLGRPIQLIANHFNIEIPTGSVYHYVVGIFSETAKETKPMHQHEDQQESHRAPSKEVPARPGKLHPGFRRP
ncbi:uncharacterized protein LOC144114796 [Amblyomma americanum]